MTGSHATFSACVRQSKAHPQPWCARTTARRWRPRTCEQQGRAASWRCSSSIRGHWRRLKAPGTPFGRRNPEANQSSPPTTGRSNFSLHPSCSRGSWRPRWDAAGSRRPRAFIGSSATPTVRRATPWVSASSSGLAGPCGSVSQARCLRSGPRSTARSASGCTSEPASGKASSGASWNRTAPKHW